MPSWFFKALLVFVTFALSLALPYGLYLSLALLVGINFFVARSLSYQLAFSLGLLFDSAGVHFGFLSSMLVLLLAVKGAELFAERVFSFQSEWRDYFLSVTLLTILIQFPYLVFHFGWPTVLIILQFVLLNLILSALTLFVLLQFRAFYSLVRSD